MKKYLHILSFLFIAFGFASCASSGSLSDSGSKQTYQKNIQLINNYFLQISRSSSLLVDIKQNDEKRKVYTISRRKNDDQDQKEPNAGHVYINFITEDKTSVRVDNPDYSFNNPKRRKINYQQFIFSRLQEMLKDQ